MKQTILCFLILVSSCCNCEAASALNWPKGENACLHQFGVFTQTTNIPAARYFQSESINQRQDLDGEMLHKYFGYGAALTGAITLFSNSSVDFHQAAGISASGLAFATLASGYLTYRHDIDWEDGLSSRNAHVLVGGLACAGFIAAAVLGGADKDHGGIGGVSVGAMVISVATIKGFIIG